MIMLGSRKTHLVKSILGPDESEAEVTKQEHEEGHEAFHLATGEFIDHVHNKDVKGAAEAFKAMYASCEANEPDDEHYEG